MGIVGQALAGNRHVLSWFRMARAFCRAKASVHAMSKGELMLYLPLKSRIELND